MLLKKILLCYLFVFFVNGSCYTQITSSIFLLYPNNGQIVEEFFPVFNWTNQTTTNSTYKLILVEILEGQTPESAIQSNLPSFVQEGLTTNTLLYPFEAPFLEKNKKYAWQIITSQGYRIEGNTPQTTTSSSEVFWFEYVAEKNLGICTIETQGVINDSFYYLNNYNLYFKFTEDILTQPNKCSYRFLDSNRNLVSIPRRIKPIRINNYSKLSIRQYRYFRLEEAQNKFFYLEIVSPEGISYFIKFLNR